MSGFITADGADYLMAVFGGVEAPLSQFYVALVTETVGTSESGSELMEPAHADYARAVIYNGPENWTVAYGTLTNIAEVSLPVPGVDPWTGIVGWAICDAETDGRVFYAGDDVPYDIDVGEQVVFPAGSISLSMELGGWREVV